MPEKQSFRARTAEQIDQCAALLKLDIPKEGWRITYCHWREKRSLSQNSFQHAIYADVSKYLIQHGRNEYTPDRVKELLKYKFLGWIEREFVDVVTGERTIHKVLRATSALDVGEAYHYTTAILDWAQSIGCDIKIPADSEYMQLMNKQNQ